MSNEIIKMSDIQKVYRTEEMETHAVAGISFSINKGEYVAISGPSGCGKSTLLSMMGLLDSPDSGTYFLNGKNVTDFSRGQLADVRNQEIGFVFQSFNLIESLTVANNVRLPLVYRKNFTEKEMDKRVADVLDVVGMSHRAKHMPTQLSGGQQQRVAIARAIIGEPSIILADEPTGNLDSKSASTIMELLKTQHQKGATICIVTHDPRYVKDATRTINLMDGKLVSESAKSGEQEYLDPEKQAVTEE